MNLLLFDITNQEKKFYFNNLGLQQFLEIFSQMQYIVLNELFAHSSLMEYDASDFSKKITVAELQTFKSQNSSVHIDKINFSIDCTDFNVSDEYEYIITSIEPHFTIQLRQLYELIEINDDIVNEAKRNAGKYILVEKKNIIKVFSSFDDYLESDFSSKL